MTPPAVRATSGRDTARVLDAAALSKVTCAAAIAFTALGTVLLVASARAGIRPNFENYGPDAALALTFPVVGALVVARQPRNPVGWLFSACGMLSGAVVLSEQYARYGLVTRPGSLPGALVAASVQSWLWLPAVFPVPTFLFLLFPDGRLISRRWLIPAWAALAALLTSMLCLMLLRQHLDLIGPGVTNVLSVAALEPLIRHLFPIAVSVFFVASVASVGALVLRLRRAEGLLRRQLGLVAAAALLLVVELLVNSFLPGWAAIVLQAVAFALVPVAAGIAMVRYQLYGFELVLNRTLVYVALSGFVIGTYVATVGVIVHFFPSMDTEGSLLATGLVAIAFQPLRRRLQLGVDRLMYGERHDPYMVLSLLGRRLETSVAPGDAAGVVVDTVTTALRLPYAAVEMMGEGGPMVVAARGCPAEDTVALDVSDHGVIVGRLLVSPRSAGE
ncbi:MAG: hypothetical protein M3256_25850 [Actinomycetota bacterium]|nr:hypothetical protein [Actinomycetota bacterium]